MFGVNGCFGLCFRTFIPSLGSKGGASRRGGWRRRVDARRRVDTSCVRPDVRPDVQAVHVSSAAPTKKLFDRGGPVWPPRSNVTNDRLRRGSGRALPPQPKIGGSGGQRPPAKIFRCWAWVCCQAWVPINLITQPGLVALRRNTSNALQTSPHEYLALLRAQSNF